MKSISPIFLATTLGAILSACTTPTTTSPPSPAYTTYLYMTDTANGHVYTYDPAKHTGSDSSLVTTAGSTSDIKFYKGTGYVAVGYGTGAGVYFFDPSATAPSAKRIAGTGGLLAEYLLFYSPTKAFFTTFGSGVYGFDPSTPTFNTAVAIAGTATLTMQEIILGSDGMIYAADNGNGKILKIDPSNNSLSAMQFTASAGGTTGLASGIYHGNPGIFVANTGGYDLNNHAQPGTIDFINVRGTQGVTSVVGPTTGFSPGKLFQTPGGNLVATGYGHTYLIIGLSSTTPSMTEVRPGGTSFGSFSIAFDGTNLYVPSSDFSTNVGHNKLYVFDASGTHQPSSPVSVMTVGDNISNVAFYQN